MSFLTKYLCEERWTQHLALPSSDGQVLCLIHYTGLFRPQEAVVWIQVRNDFDRLDWIRFQTLGHQNSDPH
jgi:hypothetical protein